MAKTRAAIGFCLEFSLFLSLLQGKERKDKTEASAL